MLPFMLGFSLVGSALAQEPESAPPPEDGEVGALRERVRQLERAVDELRGASEAAPTEIPLDLQTRVHGYGAVNLNYLEEYKVLAFNLDEIMIQYSANLDRTMTVNTELSFEAKEEGVDVGIEQLELLVAPRPGVQVIAGAFHLPLSPWAVTASQGAYRYLSTAVPEALEETPGEEFLPIDQTGLQVRGQIPVGFWQLSYAGSVSNGRAPDPGASPQLTDFNDFKALMARLSVQSPAGVQVGAGLYYDVLDVHDETLLDGTEDEDEAIEKKTIIDDAPEIIVGASLVWHGGPVELDSEFYLTTHQVGGKSYTSPCGFFMVGVPVKKATPFMMLDYVSINPDDPIYARFDGTGPELEILPGVRRELGLHLAWKLMGEVAYEFDSLSWGWGVQSQLAAGF